MKKLLFFVSWAMLFACEKENNPPLPPVPIPVISTNPDQDIKVNKNESLTISWKAEGLTSFKVLLNDEVISTNLNDSIKLDSLKINQFFVFSGSSSSGTEKRKEIKIEVTEILLPGLIVEITPDTIFPITGGCAFIHWETTNAESVYINGESKDLSGHMLTPWFYENDYHLLFHIVGPGGTKDSLIILEIEKPTGSDAILVNPDYWVEIYSEISIISSTGPWEPTNIDYTIPCVADNQWKFKASPRKELIYTLNTLCEGEAGSGAVWYWNLVNDTIYWGNDESDFCVINLLTPDSLIWVKEGQNITWNGTEYVVTPMWMKYKLISVP